MFICVHLWFLLILGSLGVVHAQTSGGFFAVRSVKPLDKPTADGIGIWRNFPGRPPQQQWEFQPNVEVAVETREDVRSDKLFARLYFYDEKDAVIFTHKEPSKSGKSRATQISMPTIIKKNAKLHFEIPLALRGKKWKCVAVFGDQHEAVAAIYPANESMFRLEYPEKKIVENTSKGNAPVRKAVVDPLVEHVVKTPVAAVPQVTLLLRMPNGVSSFSDVSGVFATAMVSYGVDNIRQELQKEEMSGDYRGLLSFANKHKLAILAWGSARVWDASRNYDELAPEEARKINADLDAVSDAWSRGVVELSEKHGIPRDGFLLWGNCSSAQWAQRLCLRKPEHFFATYIHMPGSYDKPDPKAAKVWWCLTIGEGEGGYERSARWFAEASKSGYHIVYRPVPGLGHASTASSNALAFAFLEFAHANRNNPKRDELFAKPAYYGDYINQVVVPAAEAKKIPAPFRVPLPTKELADLWQNVKAAK